MWLQIWTQIAQVLAPFIAAGAVWLIKDLVLHLTARAKTAYVKEFMAYLGDIVSQAVEATNGTYVDALKKARADGKLTTREAMSAFQQTKDAVRLMLTEAERKLANKFLGDFGMFINTLIEQQVRQNKLWEPTLPTPPTPAPEAVPPDVTPEAAALLPTDTDD
jgi:hypothetical protein